MPQGLQCRCTEIGQHCATNWLYLVPESRLQAGAVLHLLPDTTKNKKGGHCKVTLTRDVMCFSTWFQMAVHHHAAAGQPITNYITRPLGVGTKQFAENLLGTSQCHIRRQYSLSMKCFTLADFMPKGTLWARWIWLWLCHV